MRFLLTDNPPRHSPPPPSARSPFAPPRHTNHPAHTRRYRGARERRQRELAGEQVDQEFIAEDGSLVFACAGGCSGRLGGDDPILVDCRYGGVVLSEEGEDEGRRSCGEVVYSA